MLFSSILAHIFSNAGPHHPQDHVIISRGLERSFVGFKPNFIENDSSSRLQE